MRMGVGAGELVPDRLDLSRVTYEFARDAVCFDVEDHHRSVHL